MSEKRQTYVVGDIHGCYKEMLALEEHIHEHARQHDSLPFFVSVGDLIDRGPESFKVVQHYMQGVAAGSHAVVAGNHEATFAELYFACVHDARLRANDLPGYPLYCLPLAERFAHIPDARYSDLEYFVETHRNLYISNGGLATLQAFGANFDDPASWAGCRAELEFLFGLPLVWQNDTLVVSHALARGEHLDYARTMQAAARPIIVPEIHARQLHGLLWSRDLPETAPDPQRMHLSGHTPLQAPQYFPQSKVLMIDTACVYGRALSAWCAETEEILSVQSSLPRVR